MLSHSHFEDITNIALGDRRNMCPHIGTPGTWLGIPDFGITEALATSGAVPNTSTFVNPQVINPTGGQGATFPTAPTVSTDTGGGGSWGDPTPVVNNPTPVNNNQGSSGPGYAGNTENQTVSKDGKTWKWNGTSWNDITGGSVDTAAIDAVYNPTMNYLNQAESQVRGDYPNVLNAAQQQYETAIKELQAGKTTAAGQITSAETTAGQQKEDALSAARRLYDELRRGYSQRFGGATSAGQAASELSAVEQQRQMGLTQRDYGNTINQLSQKKVELENNYNVGAQKIMDQKSLALQQAQSNFTAQLMQIQSQRAQTESQKSAAKLDALNQLKAQAYQIQQQAVTYQQNLDMFYRQQQADLENYSAKLRMSGSGGAAIGAGYSPTTNPTSALTIGGTNLGTTNPQYTGSIKKDPNFADYSGLLGKIGYNTKDQY